MITVEQENMKVCVEFTASPLEFFGRCLLTGIVSILVIPAPWMMVWFYRWCIGKIKLSDKTEVSFSGDASQIWLPIIVNSALPLIGQFKIFSPQITLFLPFLLIPVQLYLGLIIARWFWKNVVPSCGTKVTFVGTYFQCLGWYLLFIISFITIIGWAWSNVGMIKWFCQNIKGDNHIVEFHGNGWNVLWRSIVFVLSCIVIIPIPWTTMWLIKWYMSNISIKKGQWGEI